MKVYTGKEMYRDTIAAHTCTMVRDLCKSIEGVGHKLYMDVFSSPDLLQSLIMKRTSSLTQGLHSTRLGLK
jgi:hypothetical protein